MSLLKFSGVFSVRYRADSTAAIISLVVVFPTLPVIWTKGMSNRSRYAFARAFRARRVSST